MKLLLVASAGGHLAQLLSLGLAWNLRSGAYVVVGVVLAVTAVVALAGVLHPRSIDALERAR